ncbi:MAG: rRNA methyltransferase, partial [Treponema sp.]|nr:rRNA methyltransferase [Treponema sp.]
MNLFRPPDPDSGILQDELIRIINKIFPLPARFARGLPADVQELSSLFTSRREERGHSYLGKPNLLSAYLRYFLPWNVYRLCRLLPSLPLDLKEGSIVFDIGSGPLTFALALWISCP